MEKNKEASSIAKKKFGETEVPNPDIDLLHTLLSNEL